MKLKENKGITLMILVITVIVLIILAGVAISTGINLTDTAKFENMETYLLLIQSKTKIMSEKWAIGEIDEDELYGTKVEDGGDYDGWYVLSTSDLYNMGLEDLAANKYYVYYGTMDDDGNVTGDVDVAYPDGIEYDGTTYYKLSEIGRKYK